MKQRLPDWLLVVLSAFCLFAAILALRGLKTIDPPWRQMIFSSLFFSPALFLWSVRATVVGPRSMSSLATLIMSALATGVWVVAVMRRVGE